MAIRPIAPIGNPVLRSRTIEVTRSELATDAIQQLIDDMIDTMRDAGGAGIAANQVYETSRIATIEVTKNPRYPYKPPIPLTVIVNPRWRPVDEEVVTINEGCLSVPLRGELQRSVNIEVTYMDRLGVEHTEFVRGLTAGTFQHEIDHLDGGLIVDRIDPRTMATWDQYDLHQRDDFVRRITEFAERVGS